MYKMSNVIYKLSNGTIVKTLAEAEKSGLSFVKEYEPIHESSPVDKEVRVKTLKAFGIID